VHRTALIDTLKSCGAQVTVREYPSGHEIAEEEVKDAVAFLLHADVS
jgi:predicted esterase